MTRDERFLREAITDDGEYTQKLARLHAGEPLAHLLGEWDFYDLTFKVTADTLIPRPETEHLVEYAIKHLPQGAHFADLCTGSGCVALTVLAHRPDTTAVAVDLSAPALSVAMENAKRLGLADRISFLEADICAAPLFERESLSAILSNPPYIASAVVDTLEHALSYEPRMALDGGADGLLFYRALLSLHLSAIKQTGFLAMEIGYDQGDALLSLAPGAHIYKDYSGNDRVVVLKKA